MCSHAQCATKSGDGEVMTIVDGGAPAACRQILEVRSMDIHCCGDLFALCLFACLLFACLLSLRPAESQQIEFWWLGDQVMTASHVLQHQLSERAQHNRPDINQSKHPLWIDAYLSK